MNVGWFVVKNVNGCGLLLLPVCAVCIHYSGALPFAVNANRAAATTLRWLCPSTVPADLRLPSCADQLLTLPAAISLYRMPVAFAKLRMRVRGGALTV